MLLLLSTLLGCTGQPAAADSGEVLRPEQEGAVLLSGARLPGAAGPTSLLLVDGRIEALDPESLPAGTETVDLSGRWLAPAFIDSHVHLAYLPEAAALLRGGVVGAVDLAAPVEQIGSDQGAMRVRWSGPMVTAEGGYPTQSWGRNGYGLEVAGTEAASAAVESLAESGATVIKLPAQTSPGLTADELAAAVQAARTRGLPVASHAMDAEQVKRVREAGVDVLAHTPTGALDAETVAAWEGGAVVSTLAAFGGSSTTVANLAALREAGATVLYGTDFGNTRDASIQRAELSLLVEAGLDGAAILEAGTRAPAALWGLDELGELAPGKAACLLVLATDPHEDPLTLADPVQVWIDGVAID